VLGIFATGGGLLWRAASAWTKKAIAMGERAEAEKRKEEQVTELRRSHEKFMERFGAFEKEVAGVAKHLEILSARIDEREKLRRDTLGIPVRSDGE
jgi:hypothetical protein